MGNVDDTTIYAVVPRDVSKAAKSLGVVRRSEKLFDCPPVLKIYFNAYILSSLKYCAYTGKSS